MGQAWKMVILAPCHPTGLCSLWSWGMNAILADLALGEGRKNSQIWVLRSESETKRKPQVPASPRGEALFRCSRPSGVPRGPASSKATLWVKAQHDGALPPPCIVRKDPRVPHTARRGA